MTRDLVETSRWQAIDHNVTEALCRRGMARPAVADFNYVKAGIVDSLGLLGFVLELEEVFSITLTDDEIASPEFRTLGGLMNLIERKLQ
jgi:acyl carrier protein